MKNYEAKIEQNLSSLFGDKKFVDFCKEQGQKLGYPFFVYDNGECGKNFVADNPQVKTCLKVYRLCSMEDEAGNCCDLTEALRNKEEALQEIRTLILSQKKLSEKQECILVLCGSLMDVRVYLCYVKQLTMSAFQILVKRDSFPLLEMCIYGGLTVEQDIYLVQHGSRYLLSHYVKDYNLKPQVEIELVNRYDFELWDFYTENGDFCPSTYDYLRKLAEKDEQVRSWLRGMCVY